MVSYLNCFPRIYSTEASVELHILAEQQLAFFTIYG